MNISIPFIKKIPFKTKIAEICSIALEKDISINESELLGDFIVSGEYKNLDINVDTYPFEHVIPFKVDLDKDIIIDTLSYDIEDFSYEIENDEVLCVSIILHVNAEKKLIDESIFIKDDTITDRLEILENIDETKDEITETNNVNIISGSNLKEDYITYHIHVVKLNETIETISKDYKIDKDKLLELNDINSVEIGDKIIIPDIDEE